MRNFILIAALVVSAQCVSMQTVQARQVEFGSQLRDFPSHPKFEDFPSHPKLADFPSHPKLEDFPSHPKFTDFPSHPKLEEQQRRNS